MGTQPSVLNKSFPMSTDMTGFRWFSKIFATKVASALEGLTGSALFVYNSIVSNGPQVAPIEHYIYVILSQFPLY